MDKMSELAKEILSTAISSLSGEFAYFAYPIGKLNFQLSKGVKRVVTNGKTAFVDEKFAVLSTASNGVKAVATAILHATLHCLFTHPFKCAKDCRIYDLCCDIVVGYVLDGLGYPFGDRNAQNKRNTVYKSIIDEFGGVNDSSADRYCKKLTVEDVEVLSKNFSVCDHDAWAGRAEDGSSDDGDGETTVSFYFDESQENTENLLSAWKAISQSLLPQIGKLNPELKRVLSLKVSDKSDYEKFLRSFIRRKERVLQSDDEFDYIAYYYGLKTYGNMPLVEGLETSDLRDCSEIAVAIDTSGSTDGEPIKRLLSEVFSLLKSMETGSKKYQVRIIQCDLKIQKEDVVKDSDEFSKMLENYSLLGGGGTDFTPVFKHLTDLKRKGAKIEGLIYFTDGVGVYPRDIPPFKTCFVLLGENENVQVPHFAYKINLEI